eukprot:6192336-Pleurochrysis_carterae.AAC.3
MLLNEKDERLTACSAGQALRRDQMPASLTSLCAPYCSGRAICSTLKPFWTNALAVGGRERGRKGE